MNEKHIRLRDKFRGAILGAAIGDALGMPTENISKGELTNHYNGQVVKFENPLPWHPCSHLKAGQYTDDTQQLLLLAESLVKNNGFDLKSFAKDIGVWGYRCVNEPNYDRFGGGTSVHSALKLYGGEDPQTAGNMGSVSCGSAMRVAPIGLFYFNKPELLDEVARGSSLITHANPIAIDSARFVARTIAKLVNGAAPISAIKSASTSLGRAFSDKINYVIDHSSENPELVGKTVGIYSSSLETVPMAAHCFINSPDTFEETIINSANLVPGDTDSIACIAGAFSGAYNGYNLIPDKFKRGLENRSQLENLADELLEKSLSANGTGVE